MHIFLDIDGVLNSKKDWKNKYTFSFDCLHIFDLLLQKLKKKYENIYIVLSSSWRLGANEEILKPLLNILDKNSIQIVGYTPKSNKTRQEEILYYIKRNKIEKYIILDDDQELFPDKNTINIYFVNYLTGLVKNDIKEIINIIKKGK